MYLCIYVYVSIMYFYVHKCVMYFSNFNTSGSLCTYYSSVGRARLPKPWLLDRLSTLFSEFKCGAWTPTCLSHPVLMLDPGSDGRMLKGTRPNADLDFHREHSVCLWTPKAGLSAKYSGLDGCNTWYLGLYMLLKIWISVFKKFFFCVCVFRFLLL